MTEFGAREARARLSELLARAKRGACITVTRYGVPVASLVPVGDARRRRIEEAIAALKAFRKGRRLESREVTPMIADGRR